MVVHSALYLPRSWVDDPDRRDRAGVPDDTEFITRTSPCRRHDLPGRHRWGPGRSGHRRRGLRGRPNLRATIRRHGLGYVLSMASSFEPNICFCEQNDAGTDSRPVT